MHSAAMRRQLALDRSPGAEDYAPELAEAPPEAAVPGVPDWHDDRYVQPAPDAPLADLEGKTKPAVAAVDVQWLAQRLYDETLGRWWGTNETLTYLVLALARGYGKVKELNQAFAERMGNQRLPPGYDPE